MFFRAWAFFLLKQQIVVRFIFVILCFSIILFTFALEMIETLLISGVLLAIGMALLLVKVLVRKDGTFSSQHIHDSEAMKERGIHCVMDQDREMRAQKKSEI